MYSHIVQKLEVIEDALHEVGSLFLSNNMCISNMRHPHTYYTFQAPLEMHDMWYILICCLFACWHIHTYLFFSNSMQAGGNQYLTWHLSSASTGHPGLPLQWQWEWYSAIVISIRATMLSSTTVLGSQHYHIWKVVSMLEVHQHSTEQVSTWQITVSCYACLP